MTAERSIAYAEVRRQLQRLGPAALHPHELEILRSAADDLLLSDDERAQTLAMAAADALLTLLVSGDRWPAHRAVGLRAALRGCAGPIPVLPPRDRRTVRN